MQLRIEFQQSRVENETAAIAAVMRLILAGLLHSLHRARVERLGGYDKITLWDLAREFIQNDGHSGVCFEYAVHDAVRRGDALVIEPLGGKASSRSSDSRSQASANSRSPTSGQ